MSGDGVLTLCDGILTSYDVTWHLKDQAIDRQWHGTIFNVIRTENVK